MSPAAEIGLGIGRELRKSVRSVKGIILGLLSILGGLGITMVVVWASGMMEQQSMRQHGLGPDELKSLKIAALVRIYGEEQGTFFAEVPAVLFVMFQVMVWLAPLFIALLGYDAISGETQHRTVRFWTVRTRRISYYLGKLAGLWVVNAIVWLGMSVFVWIVAAARGDATIGECVGWGARMWLVALPMSAVWAALATFVASQFKRPMIALLVTLGVFFVFWLLYVINGVLYSSGTTEYRPFVYVYANFYVEYLLTSNVGRFFTGLLPCIGLTAAFAGLGAWRFQTRDV